MLRRMPAGVTPDFTTAALSVISLAARAVPTKRRGRSKRVLVVQAYAPQKCHPACVAPDFNGFSVSADPFSACAPQIFHPLSASAKCTGTRCTRASRRICTNLEG